MHHGLQDCDAVGIGSETQKPLAIVVIGGALALVVLPRLLQPALLSLGLPGTGTV